MSLTLASLWGSGYSSFSLLLVVRVKTGENSAFEETSRLLAIETKSTETAQNQVRFWLPVVPR